jgi:hypothetical protein
MPAGGLIWALAGNTTPAAKAEASAVAATSKKSRFNMTSPGLLGAGGLARRPSPETRIAPPINV